MLIHQWLLYQVKNHSYLLNLNLLNNLILPRNPILLPGLNIQYKLLLAHGQGSGDSTRRIGLGLSGGSGARGGRCL